MFPDSNKTCLLPPIDAHLFVQDMQQATGARPCYLMAHMIEVISPMSLSPSCPMGMIMVLVSILGRIKRVVSM